MTDDDVVLSHPTFPPASAQMRIDNSFPISRPRKSSNEPFPSFDSNFRGLESPVHGGIWPAGGRSPKVARNEATTAHLSKHQSVHFHGNIEVVGLNSRQEFARHPLNDHSQARVQPPLQTQIQPLFDKKFQISRPEASGNDSSPILSSNLEGFVAPLHSRRWPGGSGSQTMARNEAVGLENSKQGLAQLASNDHSQAHVQPPFEPHMHPLSEPQPIFDKRFPISRPEASDNDISPILGSNLRGFEAPVDSKRGPAASRSQTVERNEALGLENSRQKLVQLSSNDHSQAYIQPTFEPQRHPLSEPRVQPTVDKNIPISKPKVSPYFSNHQSAHFPGNNEVIGLENSRPKLDHLSSRDRSKPHNQPPFQPSMCPPFEPPVLPQLKPLTHPRFEPPTTHPRFEPSTTHSEVEPPMHPRYDPFPRLEPPTHPQLEPSMHPGYEAPTHTRFETKMIPQFDNHIQDRLESRAEFEPHFPPPPQLHSDSFDNQNLLIRPKNRPEAASHDYSLPADVSTGSGTNQLQDSAKVGDYLLSNFSFESNFGPKMKSNFDMLNSSVFELPKSMQKSRNLPEGWSQKINDRGQSLFVHLQTGRVVSDISKCDKTPARSDDDNLAIGKEPRKKSLWPLPPGTLTNGVRMYFVVLADVP